MNIRIRILIIIATLLALIFVVNKIKNRGIELKYSLLWIMLGVGIIVLACFPQISEWLAEILGIYQPMNFLFFAGFCFTLPIIFSLSISVSKMSNKIKRLSQELALLQKELQEKEIHTEGKEQE